MCHRCASLPNSYLASTITVLLSHSLKPAKSYTFGAYLVVNERVNMIVQVIRYHADKIEYIQRLGEKGNTLQGSLASNPSSKSGHTSKELYG